VGFIVQKVSGSRQNPELGEQQVPTIFEVERTG
jgi:hypothetical protein